MGRAVFSVSLPLAVADNIRLFDSKSAIIAAAIQKVLIDDPTIPELYKKCFGQINSKLLAKAIVGDKNSLGVIVSFFSNLRTVRVTDSEMTISDGEEETSFDLRDSMPILRYVLEKGE